MNKPIISVPTVDSLAYNLHGTDKLVCPIMDAEEIRYIQDYMNL